MNDATSDTHADSEALEAERQPNAGDGDEKPFDIDPNDPVIKNIDESVERAAW